MRIGADGTDDDVIVGICSDSKNDCCEKKLSRALSDDWKKNKVINPVLAIAVRQFAKLLSLPGGKLEEV